MLTQARRRVFQCKTGALPSNLINSSSLQETSYTSFKQNDNVFFAMPFIRRELAIGRTLAPKFSPFPLLTSQAILSSIARRGNFPGIRSMSGIPSSKGSTESVVEAYCRLVKEGRLAHDSSQEEAAKKLQLLYEDIEASLTPSRASTPTPSGSGVARPEPQEEAATDAVPAAAAAPVKGVYLWGGVGTGKTLLMDTFVRSVQSLLNRASAVDAGQGQQPEAAEAPPAAARLLRLHFHEFMAQRVHGPLHRIQVQRPKKVVKTAQGKLVYRSHGADPSGVSTSLHPLDQVSLDLARSCRVLCLDELHVTDVADAMVLGRLLSNLLHMDVRVVFTSNSPPADLYKGGLSRHYFVPFMQQVQGSLIVSEVAAAGRDFRVLRHERPVASVGSSTVEPAQPCLARDSAATEGAEEQARNGKSEAEAGPPSKGRGICFTSSSAMDSKDGQNPVAAAAGARPPWWVVGGGAKADAYVLERVLLDHRAETSQAGFRGEEATGFSAVTVPSAYGRRLTCERVIGDTAVFDFEELCGSRGLRAESAAGGGAAGTLSASDYVALCRRFPRVVITGLVQFPAAASSSDSGEAAAHARDSARRLVAFLDMACQYSTSLVVTSDVEPSEIFAPLTQQLDAEIGEMEAERRREARRRRPERELREQQGKQEEEARKARGAEDAKEGGRTPPSGAFRAPESNSGRRPGRQADATEPAASPHTPQTPSLSSSSSPPLSGPVGSRAPGPVVDLDPGSASSPPDDLVVPSSLKHEEKLMYRRATSRLLGLCTHVVPFRPA